MIPTDRIIFLVDDTIAIHIVFGIIRKINVRKYQTGILKIYSPISVHVIIRRAYRYSQFLGDGIYTLFKLLYV